MEKTGVVVVGSHVQGLFMRVERFPTADETVLGWDYREALDGGKGSHQAIACGRLGLPTFFVGCVGRDRLGDRGADWMAEAGVDLTCLVRSGTAATGCGFVMINREGVPAITTAMGANEEFSPADVDRAAPALARARIVLVTFEIPSATALYAIRRAKELGAMTILTPGPAEPLPREALESLDILVPNRTEGPVLMGRESTENISARGLAKELQDYFGVQKIVITLGAEGALVREGADEQAVPAFKVSVVDTPGAGDAFTAGLACGLMAGAPLAEAARFGCLTAARAVTVRESVPGFATFAEIEDFAAAQGFEIPAFIARARHASR
ncbi:MAG: ribokinase [Acidobacteria bacterium]|nr:ribokinase [Acidobacteriota bacterium]